MPVPNEQTNQPAAQSMADLFRSTPRTTLIESGQVPAQPRPPFLLRHHIKQHSIEEIDGQLWVLPCVRHHFIVGGVYGNKVLQEGMRPSDSWEDSARAANRKGFVYLPADMQIPAELVVGGNGDGYSKDAPCRDPKTGNAGVLYLDKWQIIEDPETPADRARITLDRELWNRYRLWLVEQGILQPASSRTVARLAAEAQNDLGQMQGLTNTLPDEVRKRVLEGYQAQVDRIASAKVPEKGGKAALTFKKGGRK